MEVLLADDQPEIRSALRLLLQQESWLSAAGEAADSAELLAAAAVLRPDVVLLDWELPSPANLRPETRAEELLENLREACPGLRIVAMSSRPEARTSALAAGADAFVSKGDPAEHLLRTLEHLNVRVSEEK